MPVFDFFHWKQDRGQTLAETGPIVPVEIKIPEALEALLVSEGKPLPSPAIGYALIDTGASGSAVHEGILTRLGIQPIDQIPTSTPHGDGVSFVYAVRVTFPAMTIENYPMARVMGCNLKWTTASGEDIIMLLGRDLLRHFLLIYNGVFSDVTLSF